LSTVDLISFQLLEEQPVKEILFICVKLAVWRGLEAEESKKLDPCTVYGLKLCALQMESPFILCSLNIDASRN
jgi:hypothetical protein